MSRLQRLGLWIENDMEGKSLKSQMRRADKARARFTLILGEDELARGEGTLKEMVSGVQTAVPLSPEGIAGHIRTHSS